MSQFVYSGAFIPICSYQDDRQMRRASVASAVAFFLVCAYLSKEVL
jgi:hypothetical protein